MATKQDKVEMLRAAPLFSSLTNHELKLVLAVAKEVDHDEGKAIVEEGTTGVGFHLILQGEAKVSIGGKVKAYLGPGDYFGEIALLDGGPRTATVTAETPLRTLSLLHWDFRPLVKQNPEIAYKLLLHLCALLRQAQRLSTDISA